MKGKVTAFDEPRGLGTIEGEAGTAFPFHCTQILDGTRTIEVGADVTFDVVPGHMGQWEATAIAAAPTG